MAGSLMSYSVVRWILAAAVYVAMPIVQAQPVGTEPARMKTLIVETVYVFKVANYKNKPAVPLRSGAKSRATPEDVVAEMLSSMQAGDWNWNSSLWTQKSLLEMNARDAKAGKTSKDWTKKWQSEKDLNYVFLRRVEYRGFVIVEYEALASGGVSKYKDSIALEKVGNSWFLTQALASDPVLMHWDSPTGRVQVAPDI